ncbi:MAG: hemerythrin family protein [Defluviitaleaceae bacterium]|nr:hemerythrin family protein [Defluviitaleaceae bacterium]MCL2240410.1 hemerythrin family protein [Defluviitaleaceae bacterium]
MHWHKSYETGNTIVDKDHKEIFELVNKLINSNFSNKVQDTTNAIDYLSGYVLRHFANEERLMEESSYPQASTHKQIHQDFVTAVTQLKNKLNTHPDTSAVVLEINKTIVDWLSDHVLGSDKAMAEYYRTWALAR